MGWWDDAKDWAKGAGAYALNPSMALGADSLGIGGYSDKLFGNRFDQAQQYGASDRNNFNLPGYDAMQGRYDQYLGQVDNRGQAQAGYERQQQSLADLLGARARGQDSVAELQLRQAADQGMHQQQAMAAGARPGSSAMAARLAGQNMGRMQAGLGQAAAIARAQEAQMAAQGLGGVLGQMRGANLAQTSADDQARQGLLNQSLGAAQAQQAGGMGYEQIQGQKYGAALGVPTTQEKALGAATGLAGAAGMLSDERAKTSVRPGGAAADRFLGSLQPQSYRMKPGFMLPGELAESQGAPTLGVMAQDVKSTPMGAQGVGTDQQTGLHYLDPRRLTTALAAGLGRLNERLGQLEERRSVPVGASHTSLGRLERR